MNKQISVIFKFENIIFSDTKQKLIFLCFMRFRSFLKSLVVKGVVPPPPLSDPTTEKIVCVFFTKPFYRKLHVISYKS